MILRRWRDSASESAGRCQLSNQETPLSLENRLQTARDRGYTASVQSDRSRQTTITVESRDLLGARSGNTCIFAPLYVGLYTLTNLTRQRRLGGFLSLTGLMFYRCGLLSKPQYHIANENLKRMKPEGLRNISATYGIRGLDHTVGTSDFEFIEEPTSCPVLDLIKDLMRDTSFCDTDNTVSLENSGTIQALTRSQIANAMLYNETDAYPETSPKKMN
ncbi:hypothetical protein EDB86DRAFT_2825148 [Lactarius hatsudake]|nr:hypothetical protein EDB86DRAFT_2825148 [Lactarius hatsudake]